ncbi:N-acetylmuramoyl-L-alanine amidase [Collibacillus ludicampi]|uniref:N-acetylmuramoyl-L-alanine amidase n=1 Tax=Collibacillus ludicampi TaxID=2771369 RepID=A0AAV4LK50_9BACL|nr:N-acetylmuramoyl-L-alanine amidase [Collibacillus ludicampi]GIM48217.1 N-acetylmuramoyl-L-alanine amidase [Collibacillus ludicampi]
MARILIKSVRISFSRFIIPGILLIVFICTISFFSGSGILRTTTHTAETIVLVDAGHGGYDPGVKAGKVLEKDLTLTVAKKLKTALEQRGMQCALTRDTDTDFAEKGQQGKIAKRGDLNKRIEIATQTRAQIFVSIHVNNSTLATRGGAEVFYNQVDGAQQLGEAIQDSLHRIPGMSKRSAKPETYYLLRNLNMPAVIVEIGYLNIAVERQKLTNPEYQEQLAQAIASGIEEFVKGK